MGLEGVRRASAPFLISTKEAPADLRWGEDVKRGTDSLLEKVFSPTPQLEGIKEASGGTRGRGPQIGSVKGGQFRNVILKIDPYPENPSRLGDFHAGCSVIPY